MPTSVDAYTQINLNCKQSNYDLKASLKINLLIEVSY